MIFSARFFLMSTFFSLNFFCVYSSPSIQNIEKAELSKVTSLVKKAAERGWTQQQLNARLLRDSYEYVFQVDTNKQTETLESIKKKLRVLGIVSGIAVVCLIVIALNNHGNYESERNRRIAIQQDQWNLMRNHEEVLEQHNLQHERQLREAQRGRVHAEQQLQQVRQINIDFINRLEQRDFILMELRQQNTHLQQELREARQEVLIRDQVLNEAGRQYREYQERQQELFPQQQQNQPSVQEQPEEYVVRNGNTIFCTREGENLVPHVENID